MNAQSCSIRDEDGFEAGATQGVERVLGVLGTARLDAELEDDVADLQTVTVARVHGLDHVRAGLGDELGDAGQLTWTVGRGMRIVR